MLRLAKKYTTKRTQRGSFQMKKLNEIGWGVGSASSSRSRFDQAHRYRTRFSNQVLSLIWTNNMSARPRLALKDHPCLNTSLRSLKMKWLTWWILKILHSQVQALSPKVTNNSSQRHSCKTDPQGNCTKSIVKLLSHMSDTVELQVNSQEHGV